MQQVGVVGSAAHFGSARGRLTRMNALRLPKPQVDPLLDPSDALLDSSQIAVHRLCVCAT